MADPLVGGLFDQETLDAKVRAGETPEWVADHWRTFNRGLLGSRNDTPLPCFFGAESVRDGEPLYTAVR